MKIINYISMKPSEKIKKELESIRFKRNNKKITLQDHINAIYNYLDAEYEQIEVDFGDESEEFQKGYIPPSNLK